MITIIPVILSTFLMLLGIQSYMGPKRSITINRAMTLQIFAHSLIYALILISVLKVIHPHFPEYIHTHISETIQSIIGGVGGCEISLNCSFVQTLLLGIGIPAAALVLNQTASRMMTRMYRMKSDVSLSELLAKKYSQDGNIFINITKDTDPYAFTYALLRFEELRPQWHHFIFISKGMTQNLDEEELNGVVQHEMAHIEGKDDYYAPFISAFSKIMFFNPIIRSMKRRLMWRCEFLADEMAATRISRPIILARALLKTYLIAAGTYPAAPNFSRGRQDIRLLEERIQRLIELDENITHKESSH